MKVQTYDEIESELMNAKFNLDSPYNDGWTIEMYKEKVAYLEDKLRRIGKQLTIPFPK
jgi:hypothetical protein